MFNVSFNLQSFFPMKFFSWIDELFIPIEFFPSVDRLQSFRPLKDTATFDVPLSTASIRNSFDPEKGFFIDQLDENLDTELSTISDTSYEILSLPAQLPLSLPAQLSLFLPAQF
jgi:hypothetical protein